jgi:hypothetical protein
LQCAQELKAMQEQMGKGGTLGLLQGVLNGEEPTAQAAKRKKVEGAVAAAGGGGSGSKKKS